MKIFKNIGNKSIKILSLLFIIIFIISKYTNIKIKSIQISFNSSKNYNKQNAINKKFKRNLKSVLDPDEILENEMMSRHTTFRIGGPNLLVSDKGYNGVIIQIREDNFSDLKINKNDENYYILKVGGGMLMKTLSIESCLLSLTGLEDIIDIPGTVGGGIIMNASYLGTGMYKPLLKVKVVKPDGNIMELSKEECKLVGRGSLLQDKKYIVVEATFKLEKGDQMIIQKKLTENTKKRYEKQPMYFGSAGSFFKWNQYKKANIIGYKVGNAMIYTENIAFIINLGQATSEQIMKIVNHIEKIMKDNFNINIEREVVIIGSFNNIEYY